MGGTSTRDSTGGEQDVGSVPGAAGFPERSPVSPGRSRSVPTPTLHLYAQPADPAYRQAQQHQADEHEWFHVRRIDAATHFSMLEDPDLVAEATEDFTQQLQE